MFKLVGSRSNGTETIMSDYDVMVKMVVPVGYNHQYRCPRWTDIVDTLDWDSIRESSRYALNIPHDAKLDMFIMGYCSTSNLYAVLTSTGYGVGIGATIDEAELDATK